MDGEEDLMMMGLKGSSGNAEINASHCAWACGSSSGSMGEEEE